MVSLRDHNLPPNATFQQVLTAAINDIAEHGFDSVERVKFWTDAITEAAERSIRSAAQIENDIKRGLSALYRAQVERGGILSRHPGVPAYRLQQVAPRLHAELSRRIFASADLIKLNRAKAIGETIQRFQGWATSVPAGGSDAVSKREQKASVYKSLASLPFEERRVVIDQGHKFVASLNNILATDAGAIALIWHSHWREANYNYREDHKERDGLVYLLRDNWAQQKGLVKPGPAGYYDEITAVGEEVFCRCYAQYIYSLRKLPEDMLTAKGKSELERVRVAV